MPSSPEGDQVRLSIIDAATDRDSGVNITRWESYEIASDFLTPSDAFHFTVGDEDLPADQRDALKVGAGVRLFLNGNPVLAGFIDSVHVSADKHGGQKWTVTGRDLLSIAVDSTADPLLQFKEGCTIADVLKKLFEPLWKADDDFDIDNDANRSAMTSVRGKKLSKGGKKKGPRELKSIKLHMLKPHNHEGKFTFAARVAQRQGLWIWASADGEQLIVGKPDFDQEPVCQLRRTFSGTTNVLSMDVTFSGQNQPSVLIADGFSGGAEFGKGRMKAWALNPYFGVDKDGFILPKVQEVVSKFPEAKQVILTTQPFTKRIAEMPIRPMFLHDDEAHTPEELENFVRREMSLLMRESLKVHVVVEGHGQSTTDGFIPWAVDTTVKVTDEVSGLDETMYVLSRHFTKDRHGGTHTSMELIRLNSLQF